MDTGDVNLRWAAALSDALVRQGVVHAVISPGSRSTPLTLALARQPGLRTWVLPDERSAAFFALGLSKAIGYPAIVVATSGSAPANWYPAVIEASQDLVPLLLISADRPTELHDCGENQTIDQNRLFGRYARAFVSIPEVRADDAGLRLIRSLAARTVDNSRWPEPGPVHLNVQFREPLVPTGGSAKPERRLPATTQVESADLVPAPGQVARLAERCSGRSGLIVCGRGDFGSGFAPALARVAQRLGSPILADPLSGLRFGGHDRTHVLTHYDAFLRRKAFIDVCEPDWVLRFGGPPTSKILQQYLNNLPEGIESLIVPYGSWPDPGHRASHVLHVQPDVLCRVLAEAVVQTASTGWLRAFQAEEGRAARLLNDPLDTPLEAAVLAALGEACPDGTTVFCGNSMVIRDVDSFLSGGTQHVTLMANRGASGIDGHVSTVLGMAAALERPVVGLLGDLALYHDMNGLLSARGLDASLVVFNNGGGAIFDFLPQRALPEYERYWLTPTDLDITQIARLYGLQHVAVHDAGAFASALQASLARSGVDVLEVKVDRAVSVAQHRAYWHAVASSH